MAQSLSLSPTRRTDDVGHSQTERPTDLTERGYYAVSYHSGNNIPSRAEQNRAEQSRPKIREGRRRWFDFNQSVGDGGYFLEQRLSGGECVCDLVFCFGLGVSSVANKLHCCPDIETNGGAARSRVHGKKEERRRDVDCEE